jgi:hypothetical protein
MANDQDNSSSNSAGKLFDRLRRKAKQLGDVVGDAAKDAARKAGAAAVNAAAGAAKSTAKSVGRKVSDYATRAASNVQAQVKKAVGELEPDGERSKKYAVAGRVIGAYVETAAAAIRAKAGVIASDARILYDDLKVEHRVPGMKDAIDAMLEHYDADGAFSIRQVRMGYRSFDVRAQDGVLTVTYSRDRMPLSSVLMTIIGKEIPYKTACNGSIALDKRIGGTDELARLPSMRRIVAQTLDRVIDFDSYEAKGQSVEEDGVAYSVDVSANPGQQPDTRIVNVSLALTQRRGKRPLVVAYSVAFEPYVAGKQPPGGQIPSE